MIVYKYLKLKRPNSIIIREFEVISWYIMITYSNNNNNRIVKI